MSGFWLKCDACNKDLPTQAESPMRLAVRFKPSLVKLDIDQLDPERERLCRCRSCGWVNVFVAVEAPIGALTVPKWFDIVLK